MAGMTERREKGGWKIVAGLLVAFLIVPLGSYVGCYVGMGKPLNGSQDGECFRMYDARWKATLFTPAANVESMLTGRKVSARCYGMYLDP